MRLLKAVFLAFSLAAALPGAANDLPVWALQAMAVAPPEYPAKVTSVTLFQEEAVTIDADGKRVMHERGAIKILQPGSAKISAYRTYNTKTGRIRDFQGWLISPAGRATPYAKNQILDVALSTEYVYDEVRAKVLECGTAPPGSVFAWEVIEEERSIFAQDGYTFQGHMPVLVSRFSATLPPGWETKAMVFNRESMEPRVSGSTYSWELRNLPWIEPEDHSPSTAAMVPRLAVSYFPPFENRAGLKGLKDWAAVSSWLALMVDPPAEVTEPVRAKAARLTAGVSGELDKIRAIAAFTQQTNYVEVLLNVTRGGGYTPRRAEDTLSRNYGDCKDKATLMRALLKAVGIDAYLTTITAGDRTYVRPEWASPRQFNHAIVAVRVLETVTLPTVIATARFGRLLIFDPTDPTTPLGDLPEEEQGSYALVIAGASGELLRMPLLTAEANRIDSSVEGALDSTGRLAANLTRQYHGQSGAVLRHVQKLLGLDELKKRFERGFSSRLPGATLSRLETKAQADENRLTVNVDLSAERFAQIMQGRLFVVRPGLLSSGGDYLFTARQRSAPIKLEPDLRHDSIRIKLPAGYKVDELPEPAKIQSPYGTLDATWVVRDSEVVMELTLQIREAVVPAVNYAQVRAFFDQVAGAQGAPVVLVRQ